MTTQTDKTPSTDRIEKHFELKAPRARVWRAIANAREFESWFGVKLDGTFTVGATIHGHVTIKGYEHLTIDLQIEKVDPEHYLAYRWHPYPADPKVDYSAEPMTLVEFRLADSDGGTAVTIVESGFDAIPLARRAEAFKMNDGGWAGQAKNLERYVA